MLLHFPIILHILLDAGLHHLQNNIMVPHPFVELPLTRTMQLISLSTTPMAPVLILDTTAAMMA
jgi:hypothetical protein